MNTKITITAEEMEKARLLMEEEYSWYYEQQLTPAAGLFSLDLKGDKNFGWRTSGGNWLLLVDEVEECCIYFAGRRHSFMELLRFLPEADLSDVKYIASRSSEAPDSAGVNFAREGLTPITDCTCMWLLELELRVCALFKLGFAEEFALGWTEGKEDTPVVDDIRGILPKGLHLDGEFVNGGWWWTVQRSTDKKDIAYSALYTAYKGGLVPVELVRKRLGKSVSLLYQVEPYTLGHEHQLVFNLNEHDWDIDPIAFYVK